jgi:hypothetical protein
MAFSTERFLADDDYKDLEAIRACVSSNLAFMDVGYSRPAIIQLLEKLLEAAHSNLLDDPCAVGAAGGALQDLAASLCVNEDEAIEYIGRYEDYGAGKELEEFLYAKEPSEEPSKGRSPKKLTGFAISYFLPSGQKVWCKDILGKDLAKAQARRLKLGGYRPKVHRVKLRPSELVEFAKNQPFE